MQMIQKVTKKYGNFIIHILSPLYIAGPIVQFSKFKFGNSPNNLYRLFIKWICTYFLLFLLSIIYIHGQQ